MLTKQISSPLEAEEPVEALKVTTKPTLKPSPEAFSGDRESADGRKEAEEPADDALQMGPPKSRGSNR